MKNNHFQSEHRAFMEVKVEGCGAESTATPLSRWMVCLDECETVILSALPLGLSHLC